MGSAFNMKIINNIKKDLTTLEIGDIVCYQEYGKPVYLLVGKQLCPATYFTLNLETGCIEEFGSLSYLYDLYHDLSDFYIIKSTYIKIFFGLKGMGE